MHPFEPIVIAGSSRSGRPASRPRPSGEDGGGRLRRDRRGRGLRGPLMPSGLPAAHTRNERFTEALAEAVERLAELCGSAVEAARFRSTMVPENLEELVQRVQALGADAVDDPTGSAHRAPDGTAVITVYRRPIEARCPLESMLDELVYATVVEQWAALSGVSPETVDPDYSW